MIATVLAAAAIAREPAGPRLLVDRGGSINRVVPDGSGATELLNGDASAYSPDGTLLAFVRRGDLWTANGDGSGQRPVTATPNEQESEPAWTPDGAAIAYTATNADGVRQIRIVSTRGGLSRRLAPSGAEEWSPSFSRDGKRLAFVSTRSGDPQIVLARTNGTGAAALRFAEGDAPVNPRGVAWSPGGRALAYAADTDTGSAIWIKKLDASPAQQVSPGEAHDEGPVWSPDGLRLAYTTELADGTHQVLVEDSGGLAARPAGPGVVNDWRRVPLGSPLFPDLRQRPPSGLVVSAGGRGFLLGFTSLVDNIGPGTLWIRGVRPPHSPVMNVEQYVYLASGGLRLVHAAGQLHYTVAPPHYHWHLLGFEHYELRRTSDFKLMVRDRKSGFCIADHYGIAPGVSHGPPRFLGSCAQFDPRATSVEEGASVGYTDRYPAFFHGQQLNLTGVPAGTYWLVHRANQGLGLREERYDNDVASILVRITWPGGHRSAPRVTTLRACMQERC